MKNFFLTSVIVFGIAILCNFDNNQIIDKAYAAGTCCPEDRSICLTDRNGDIQNYYGKESGSCSGGSSIEALIAY